MVDLDMVLGGEKTMLSAFLFTVADIMTELVQEAVSCCMPTSPR